MEKIAKSAKGFIYYVSTTGITGPRSLQYKDIASHIKKIKEISNTPVCVGFGIHNNKQVKKISSISDGVIVGSEIVKFIGQNYKEKNFFKKLENYVRKLRS
jgi:tryptophan synthase alpha chain